MGLGTDKLSQIPEFENLLLHTKSLYSENKLHVAMSQLMGLGTDKLSQIPEFENLLHSKQVTSK